MLRFHEQPTHPHHVVRRRREGDVPVHQPAPAMPQFAQQPYGRRPAKDQFDEFAFALTDQIPRGARDATIDRVVLRFHRDVRRHPEVPDRRDKLWNVMAPADFEQELRGFAFGPIGRGDACALHRATTIVEQQVGRTRQHGFVPVVPPIQPRVGIRYLAKRSRYALPKPDQVLLFAPMLQYLAWQEAPT
jgi:hypothetical protein